jgi:mono/diheme cytochrome c family protein
MLMKKVILVGISLVVLVIAACHSSVKVGDTKYKKTDATAGKTIYDGKCAKCHKPKDVAAYTPERWTGILNKMVPKAKLDDEETKQVTAFVMVNSKKG